MLKKEGHSIVHVSRQFTAMVVTQDTAVPLLKRLHVYINIDHGMCSECESTKSST